MRRSRERARQADLFYADLMGQPRRGRSRPNPAVEVAFGEEGLDEAMGAGALFDEVVYRGRDPNTLLAAEGEPEAAWEAVALPGSAPTEIPAGALVVERALGEGRLGCMHVVGDDVEPGRLYGPGGRIRADILVLARVSAGPARRSRVPVLEDSRVAVLEEEAPPGAEAESSGAEDLAEAVPLQGRGRFRHEPLGGDRGDNVEARFNVDASTAAGTTIDVVVHLHGYGQPRADFLARKAAAAGLDMVDGAGAVRVRASRPSLALVPRGRHGSGSSWFFDALGDRAALDALVAAGLSWLSGSVLRLAGGGTLTRGRLTMMAHSGGGAGLNALLANGLDPDEVACFDSMYGSEEPLRRWAEARIGSPQAARSGLRVFYTGCSAGSWTYRDSRWRLITTEVSARRLHHALEAALARITGAAALASRFRVERTSVGHGDIPARYAPLLLDDIAATVPNATPPPPATTRPACVANDDWRTNPPRRPGGDAPPAPAPRAAAPEQLDEPAEAPEAAVSDVEDLYAAPDARAYAAGSSAAVFRVAPTPVAVSPATHWPEATTTPDAAAQGALRAVGVNAAGVSAYAAAGLSALRPIAALFGEPALTELLGRLRYTPAQLARPPHSYDDDAALARVFGRPVASQAILAIRALLAIPGHFRELARRAGTDQEAFALENLGWLLLQSLLADVRTSSGLDFWMPSSPAFVTPFAAPPSGLSTQATRLIADRRLADTAVDAARYRARYDAWRGGAPGRLWRLETGRESGSGPAGAPFYRDPFTIPPATDIAAQRARIQAAWARRVAESDAGTTKVPLTRCDNAYLAPLGVMARIPLRGLQLRSRFPARTTAPAITSLTGLAAVRPAFEAVFQAVVDLGWNDLLFETQGMGCFRGKKLPGTPAAARRMSEHGLGIAIDLNAFENAQNTTGSMDPRIVALFEAFGFRWGRGFPTPDPMHFEYAERPAASRAAVAPAPPRAQVREEQQPWEEHVPPPRPAAEEQAEQQPPARPPVCALPRGSACAYFFKGASYLRYNIAADSIDVCPTPIARYWKLPEKFRSSLDAAVNWGDGHAYFFKQSEYVRYNIATDKVDSGPAPISRNWTKLPAEFQSDLDAAVNWGDGFAYFFKQARCLRYDIAKDRVDVAPTEISAHFKKLPAEFHSKVDSVVNWGDGNIYFFKGARYLRCRAADGVVEVGPIEIARNWKRLPPEFHDGIKAAINWTVPVDLAALMRAAGLRVTEKSGWRTRSSVGDGGCFTPIGVMMHHTAGVGPNALADVVTNVKANFFVDRAGMLTVVSGGRADHAGLGAPEVLREVDRNIIPPGTAKARGLKDSVIGNGHFYGFENENLGDGKQPWPEVQLDAMARGAAALCQLHGWSANRVISHAEWRTEKFDPLGVDMNVFRARVGAALLKQT